MSAPAVQLDHVFYAYGNRTVLRDITFTVFEGRFTSLIGPNGAGKTTCLRLILGLLRPQRGEVQVFGRPAGEARQPIGYVPQRVRVPEGFPLTVHEVVLMGRFGLIGLGRRPSRLDHERARVALARVGLADLTEARFGTLSGGQQQRVLIARALSAEPRLLVLDEPTAGLDPAARARFYDLLCDLQREERLAVLVASHDVEAVARHADALILMDGAILAEGPPTRVLEDPALQRAYGFPAPHEHLRHASAPPAQEPVGRPTSL